MKLFWLQVASELFSHHAEKEHCHGHRSSRRNLRDNNSKDLYRIATNTTLDWYTSIQPQNPEIKPWHPYGPDPKKRAKTRSHGRRKKKLEPILTEIEKQERAKRIRRAKKKGWPYIAKVLRFPSPAPSILPNSNPKPTIKHISSKLF